MLKLNMTYTYVPTSQNSIDPQEIAQEIMDFLKSYPEITLVEFGVSKQTEGMADARTVTAAIVELWNKTHSARLRMTPFRIAKVKARLGDGFTPEELLEVVKKLTQSGFHNGENDRGWCAPGPEWVLHSTERVEQWLKKTERVTVTYADEIKRHFGR